MAWFDFSRSANESTVEVITIPLFPLNTVLFPGGVLPLRIFEQRYLDMAAACMREGKPFGICLIEEGGETGKPAHPHAVGTLAEIVGWEMEQLGILQVTTRGKNRFRILDQEVGPNQSLSARVEVIQNNGPLALPEEAECLLPLLQRVIKDLGTERIPEPHLFDEAEWVGFRICEVLPIQNLAKQKLLELEDPISRLEILEKYLIHRKLLD